MFLKKWFFLKHGANGFSSLLIAWIFDHLIYFNFSFSQMFKSRRPRWLKQQVARITSNAVPCWTQVPGGSRATIPVNADKFFTGESRGMKVIWSGPLNNSPNKFNQALAPVSWAINCRDGFDRIRSSRCCLLRSKPWTHMIRDAVLPRTRDVSGCLDC